MTEQSHYERAAEILLSRRVTDNKGPGLDPAIRPHNIHDALAVQAQMIEQRSDFVAAWKCLLPPGDDKVVVAPIFSDCVQQGEVCRLMSDNGFARIEPEIAFVLGRDLPARQEDYCEDEINAAIASAHMALELMQGRWLAGAEVSFYEKLADCLVNQGLYLGPEIDKRNAMEANELAIEITQSGETQLFDGKHPNAQAVKPVHWLINYMSKRGTDFKAGQAIITGSFCGIVELQFDTATTIRYEGLGEYDLEFKTLAD